MGKPLRSPGSLWPAAILLGLAAGLAHAAPPPPLDVVVLGSGGPGATGRASSSYIVRLDGMPRILVDAGSGAFVRLGEAQLPLDGLDVILLTHLHVDHAAELPGIIKARAVSAGHPITFQVYGPPGHPAHGDVPSFPSTTRFMDLLFGRAGAFAYLKDFAAPITFRVVNLPAYQAAPNLPAATALSAAGLDIRAVPGHHGDAPAVIYRIDHGGRSVVFSGDIDPAGLPALGAISQGADLLVFNCVVLDPPGSPAVLYELHSPPRDIGAVAEGAHVGRVLLSHLSPAVESHESEVSASIAAHYPGPVTYAHDGMRVIP